MLQTIITSTILYATTALDLIVILMLLFTQYPTSKEHRLISLGQFIGSVILILLSLFFAFVLHYVPEKWILGLLGFIPIYFGLRYLFESDNEVAAVKQTLAKRQNKNLLWTVIIITVSSCGADNLGLFVPYFTSLSNRGLVLTLFLFVIYVILLGITSQKIAQIKSIHTFLKSYSRWLITAVYLGLGIMIIGESKTISHLLSFI